MSTREAILDSARSLIQRRGTNGMSYDDISRQVGIRKASIHYHFPTKNDLLAELVEGYTDVFLESVAEHTRDAENGAAQLAGFFEVFAATLEGSNGCAVCLCGMMASEVGSLNDDSVDGVREFFRKSIETLAGILDVGVEDGSLRLAEGLSHQDAADLIFSSLEGGLLSARLEGGVPRFRRLTSSFLAMLKAP
ncbi:MAG: TetR/AcrR family transcriptional regulator [Acidobacteriota bacterium]